MSLLEIHKRYNEDNWLRFMSWCEKEYLNAPENVRFLLEEIQLPRDIKIALIVRLGKHSEKWLYQDVPILDYKKPINFISTDINRETLKSVLMSMPD